MRAGLTVGLVALGILAAAAPAEARGRRGGGSSIVFVSSGRQAAVTEPRAVSGQEPRLRTAAADAGGPEPMTTGTTAPVAVREAAPAPAQPWCSTGRVFGSGAGFCAIN